jgi:hypothetical protein
LDLIVRKHVYHCSCILTAQLIIYGTVHVGVRTCTLYRVYIYGREYRMRRNRNGRNVQLGPGKQTAKTGVWFGEIERNSQIIKDYFHLPFFLLIILCLKPTKINKLFYSKLFYSNQTKQMAQPEINRDYPRPPSL